MVRKDSAFRYHPISPVLGTRGFGPGPGLRLRALRFELRHLFRRRGGEQGLGLETVSRITDEHGAGLEDFELDVGGVETCHDLDEGADVEEEIPDGEGRVVARVRLARARQGRGGRDICRAPRGHVETRVVPCPFDVQLDEVVGLGPEHRDREEAGEQLRARDEYVGLRGDQPEFLERREAVRGALKTEEDVVVPQDVVIICFQEEGLLGVEPCQDFFEGRDDFMFDFELEVVEQGRAELPERCRRAADGGPVAKFDEREVRLDFVFLGEGLR
jgi:hypothetical protein